MQSREACKLRARIPKDSCLSWVSPDSRTLIISQKPSKLTLFRQSDHNEDPFNLEASSNPDLMPSDYEQVQEVDLGVGNLIFLDRVDFDTQPCFVAVSNDKALVVLDDDLGVIFKNEELLGSADLCFFTCAGMQRNKLGAFQGGGFACI